MKYISKISFTILLATCLAGIQSCNSSKAKEENKNTSEPTQEAAIEAFVLKKGSLSSTLQIPGELIAFQQVDLYAKVSSFVKKLHVDVGSEVHQGQLLATMEAPELLSQYVSSTSRLRSQEAIYLASKTNYERLLETSKTPGTVSQNDLDLALAKQNSDLAQLETARSVSNEISDTRNYLEIRAPFSGVISARNVSTGAFVGPTGKGSEAPLFTLVEQRKLRLVVSIPEAYNSYLTPQSEVHFKVKSLQNVSFPAKVSRMAGALDTRLRSQRIEMDVVNQDKRLLPGMIAEVSIPLSRGEGSFIVPKTAVLNTAEGTYMIKAENNKSVWVPVKTGATADGKTEIFGELHEGDTFLKIVTEEVRNNSELKSFKTVNI